MSVKMRNVHSMGEPRGRTVHARKAEPHTTSSSPAAELPRVDQWRLNSTSSWYDEMWRDLEEEGLLQRHDDPYVYKVKEMAKKGEGTKMVEKRFAKYDRMQMDALKTVPFEGDVERGGGGAGEREVRLSWVDECPSVRVIRLRA